MTSQMLSLDVYKRNANSESMTTTCLLEKLADPRLAKVAMALQMVVDKISHEICRVLKDV